MLLLKSKIGLILIAMLLAALAWGAYEHQRAEKFQVQAKSLSEKVTGLSTALTSKDVVIEQFVTAAEEAQAIIDDQKISLDKAAGRMQTLRSQLAESRRHLQALEEADHENAACAVVLNTPVAVCPGFLHGMQQRANGSVQGQSGESAPAGASTGGLPADGGLPTEIRPAPEPNR